jgi:hypothetical protein
MPLSSMFCMNGIGALSYFLDRYIGRFQLIVQKPSGVGWPFLPVEILDTPISESPLKMKPIWLAISSVMEMSPTRSASSSRAIR